MHILFNMLMLVQLGRVDQSRARILADSRVRALNCNPLERRAVPVERTAIRRHVGVVYGLFGYIWMKSRYEPGQRAFTWLPNIVVWMVGWFVMCLFQIIPGVAVANAVHATGFAVGLILGRWPSLWRLLRDRIVRFPNAKDDSTRRNVRARYRAPARFRRSRSC